MKPVAFEYRAPRELGEALELLARHGDDAKVLAGGQSLVPMLNFRLVRPALLIDVNRIEGFGRLTVENGTLRIGAGTRTQHLVRSADVGAGWPLLSEAASHVGHEAVRNRGTVGGSAAHADPHSELPVALCALDAGFEIASVRGTRTLPTAEFFQDFYTTALAADELLVAIHVPAVPRPAGVAFLEHARTHGDFAVAGVAVLIEPGEGGCARAVLSILGAAPTPLRPLAVERALTGATITDAVATEAGHAAAAASDPLEPADYHRALIAELTRRALLTAAKQVAV